MMTTEEAVSNWQSIYDLSLSMIDPTSPEIWKAAGYLYPDGTPSWKALCELRSINMGGGRQNCKTKWVKSFLEAHPKAIVVECNAALRDIFIESWRGTGFVRTRVFTVTDIVSISRANDPGKLSFLSDATHIIFNDASHNNAINSMQLAKACNGLFTKEIVVIKMG